jgi:AAA+ superfamily predicted ATPase
MQPTHLPTPAQITPLVWLERLEATKAKYQQQIDAFLGCPSEETTVITDEFLKSVGQAIAHQTTGLPLDHVSTNFSSFTIIGQNVADVRRLEGAPPPVIALDANPVVDGPRRRSEICLLASPHIYSFAYTLRLYGVPIVLLSFAIAGFDECEYNAVFAVVRQDELRRVLDGIEEATSVLLQEVYLRSYSESTTYTKERVRDSSVDDLVISKTVERQVIGDLRNFFANKKWFEDQRLPYRRGYLLQGPPGNGKTSLIRVIMNTFQMNAHAPQLLSKKMDDTEFVKIVASVGSQAPAILLLEDIDRGFPKTGVRCNISMGQLLNSLDGVSDYKGLIVIATANEPEVLDPAILKRPGRFDRVVFFDNPDADLRRRYFKQRKLVLTKKELETLVADTDGFSFAQLQEVFISAASEAFNTGAKKISPKQLKVAVDGLLNGSVKRLTVVKGFGG